MLKQLLLVSKHKLQTVILNYINVLKLTTVVFYCSWWIVSIKIRPFARMPNQCWAFWFTIFWEMCNKILQSQMSANPCQDFCDIIISILWTKLGSYISKQSKSNVQTTGSLDLFGVIFVEDWQNNSAILCFAGSRCRESCPVPRQSSWNVQNNRGAHRNNWGQGQNKENK